MKKLLFTLMVGASISSITPAFSMELEEDSHSPTYLKWQDRPQELKNKINRAYNQCAEKSGSPYTAFNGSQHYTILDVEEDKLARHHITSNPTQKEFYFLDIGSGEFQWVDGLAKSLNAFSDIPDDVKINIIGVRGEGFEGPEHTVNGKCHIYKLGQFKVEEIENVFNSQRIKDLIQDNNLDLTNKFDGIWTRWCLRHLADPVGTIEQTYKFLKPNTGLFFAGNFYYGLNGQSREDLTMSSKSNENIASLLWDMKIPFLIQRQSVSRSIDTFVIRKSNAEILKLPLKYSNDCVLNIGNFCQNDSEVVTIFENIGPVPERTELLNINYNTVHGDEDLFKFFKTNRLFFHGDTQYRGF